MEQAKIERINALTRKAKEQGLTEAEAAERAALRREYIDAVKGSLERHLDNTYIVDGQGNKRKLQKKDTVKNREPSGSETRESETRGRTEKRKEE